MRDYIYDIKLIHCCHGYDVKLMWRHQRNDIVGMAAICTATVDILVSVVQDLLCNFV